jgi:DNA-binding transcriptional ArsR family regulator
MDFPVPPIEQIDLSQVFRALADPLRRAVIAELAADPADGERACASFSMPVAKSTRTHHWRVLREAGLIRQRDAGNGTFVRLRRDEFDQRFPGLLAALSRLTQTLRLAAARSPLDAGLGSCHRRYEERLLHITTVARLFPGRLLVGRCLTGAAPEGRARQEAAMPSPPAAPGTATEPIAVSEPPGLTRYSSTMPLAPVWT